MPRVLRQWHKCLIEAVRDRDRENRQRGLLLARAPQTGGGSEVPHLQRAISTKNRKKWIQLCQDRRVLLGEDEGLPDVTPLETKNRGIWAEEKKCENFDFLLE